MIATLFGLIAGLAALAGLEFWLLLRARGRRVRLEARNQTLEADNALLRKNAAIDAAPMDPDDADAVALDLAGRLHKPG